MHPAPKSRHAVILFDGACNFCNAAVQFILERDPEGYFLFAPQQSEAGKRLMRQYGLDQEENDSIFLIENGKGFSHSTAALRIAKKLPGLWKGLYVFSIMPASLRDIAYDFVSRHRYRIFGKRDCMVPKSEWKDRFLK